MIGTRLMLYFLGINMVLVLAGFEVGPAGDLLGNVQTEGFNVSDSGVDTGESVFASPTSSFIGMISLVWNFLLGGGISAVLVSAGLPWQIQWVVGIPFFVVGVLSVASLLKGWI